MIEHVVARWHAYLSGELPRRLDDLLDDDVVFYSPIVFTPQRGKGDHQLSICRRRGQTFTWERTSRPKPNGTRLR